MATNATDVKLDSAAPVDQHVAQFKDAEKTSSSSDTRLEAQHVDDEAEARRVLRKVDMRLVPMLSLLYLVSFIDRSNSTSCPIHVGV